MPSRALRFLLLASAGLVAAASCGARSSLPVPDTSQGGSGGGLVACTTGTITLTKAIPAVMFLLDRSGSMGSHLGQQGGQETRWEILKDGLATTLPPVDDTMEIGALLFPARNGPVSSNCSVPGAPALMPATGSVKALLSLMLTNTPGGSTPTADAVVAAATALLGVRAATTARTLVLATDGGPDCNGSLDPKTCRCVLKGQSCKQGTRCLDDARTVERIGQYAAKGLPTYVIGIQDEGDDQFTDVLNAMADAGGRPKPGGDQHYYAARSPDELNTALAAIRDQVTCTYLTTSVPGDAGSITVSLNGEPLPYDPTGATGWAWGNKGNGEIVLSPGTCADATAAPAAALIAEVECDVVDAGTSVASTGSGG